MPNAKMALRPLTMFLALAFLGIGARGDAAAQEEPRPSGEVPKESAASAREARGGTEWVRPAGSAEGAKWGIRGALVWGLPSGRRPSDGPRGLIRLWYPTLPGGREDLINFIAIEPIVAGKRGFSELERSELDGAQGLRLAAEDVVSDSETLSVLVRVERFHNGAHVALRVTQRAEAPDELEFEIRAEPDSAPMEACILTATMGNKARARELWLADRVVTSLELYPGYKEDGFAPHAVFRLERLRRTEAGDVIVAITTDEKDPAAVDPYPERPHWRYGGFPVTQYWKKRAGTWRDDLCAAVNARFTYWLSRHPIPGGLAFENFEMRERFYEGQKFVFGITRKTPAELGLAR